MSAAITGVAKRLFEEFAGQLAAVFETMAGTRPTVSCEEAPEAPTESGLVWKQPLAPLTGLAYVAAADEHWTTTGQRLLAAAGIEDASAEDIKSTYLETIGQAIGGLAASLTRRLHREVSSAGGAVTAEPAPWSPMTMWSVLRIGAGTQPIVLWFGLDPSIVEALLIAHEPAPAAPAEPEPHVAISESDARTFDLLLDVELPVSVSFGRAHVPLKDVLKLTTGSIVELNRAVVEPVDIIVNNCVIARGEVVVVEGNFGVRIQQVVSRSERLRTIQ